MKVLVKRIIGNELVSSCLDQTFHQMSLEGEFSDHTFEPLNMSSLSESRYPTCRAGPVRKSHERVNPIQER